MVDIETKPKIIKGVDCIATWCWSISSIPRILQEFWEDGKDVKIDQESEALLKKIEPELMETAYAAKRKMKGWMVWLMELIYQPKI